MSGIKSAGQRVTIEKSARMLPVTARAVIGPTTPVVKVDGRLLPVSTIRGGIRKGVPTFGTLQASREIATWLPEALYSLGQVVDAAVAGDPNDPTVTPELRLNAVRASAAEFSAQLLERVAAAIVGQAPAATADVSKRRSPWLGILR